MKWLICKKQYGEGCDYTIGCGMTFEIVEAETKEDILEQTIWPDGKDEFSMFETESAIETLLITPYDPKCVVELKPIEKEIKDSRIKEKDAENKNKELAELKRLQEKYK